MSLAVSLCLSVTSGFSCVALVRLPWRRAACGVSYKHSAANQRARPAWRRAGLAGSAAARKPGCGRRFPAVARRAATAPWPRTAGWCRPLGDGLLADSRREAGREDHPQRVGHPLEWAAFVMLVRQLEHEAGFVGDHPVQHPVATKFQDRQGERLDVVIRWGPACFNSEAMSEKSRTFSRSMTAATSSSLLEKRR